MSRTRSYCYTLNNYTDEDILSLSTVDCRYHIYGKEVGECGTPHLQGFIYFHNAKSFNTVRRLHDRWHIEATRGTTQQAIEYCKKEGDWYEYGEEPISQKRKGEMEKERWVRARTLAMENKLEEIDADIFIRQYGNLRKIQKDYMPDVEDNDDVTGIWYYGAAGTGKSRTARDKYPNAYLKMCNKWWDGYQDEVNVIIDDIDKNHACLGHHLKIWADRYAFLAEIKGGAIKIRPKHIVVTSQYHINEIWDDQETREALQRRFKVTHFSPLVNISN